MTEKREHIAFDVLNDYVDGLLDRPATSFVDKHIASCPHCSQQLAELRTVLDLAATLPRTVVPEEDLWGGLAESLNQRKDVVLPALGHQSTPSSPHRQPPRPRWQSVPFLAAAAVFLVVASSAITAVVLRRPAPQTVAVLPTSVRAPRSPIGSSAVLPVSFQMAEGEYNRTIDELVQAVNAQRGRLTPETIETVDHSIAVIDSAITEAREALVADPNNATLVDLLSASYQRKLDLLRRTSELSSRI